MTLSSAGDRTTNQPGVIGDVAIGGGSGTLEKTTVKGRVFVSSTANPALHTQDFFATGGIFVNQDLTRAAAGALNASANLATKTLTQTFGNITKTTTITGGKGTNVVNVISANSINLVGSILTLAGNNSGDDIFIITVTSSKADFILNGSKVILSGGLTANRVLFNFPGGGGKLSIYKSVTVEYGTLLAPRRDIVIDNPPVVGAVIGNNIDIHSGGKATNPCP